MDKSWEMLEQRKGELEKVKKEKEKVLKKAPEGTLRVCKSGERTQFYHRTDPKDFNGRYIREKDAKLVKKLAQKEYDVKVLRAVEAELHAIEKYMSGCPQYCAEQIFERLHEEKRKLVQPVNETDEMYKHRWEAFSYQGKPFLEGSPMFYTSKGERVRSKSEVIIADLLEKEGIPYRYEFPLLIRGTGYWFPDFTVLSVHNRKEFYWEHFGMMDDPAYVESCLRKIAIYAENHIFPGDNLILTYETKQTPLNQKVVKKMIDHYLKVVS